MGCMGRGSGAIYANYSRREANTRMRKRPSHVQPSGNWPGPPAASVQRITGNPPTTETGIIRGYVEYGTDGKPFVVWADGFTAETAVVHTSGNSLQAAPEEPETTMVHRSGAYVDHYNADLKRRRIDIKHRRRLLKSSGLSIGIYSAWLAGCIAFGWPLWCVLIYIAVLGYEFHRYHQNHQALQTAIKGKAA